MRKINGDPVLSVMKFNQFVVGASESSNHSPLAHPQLKNTLSHNALNTLSRFRHSNAATLHQPVVANQIPKSVDFRNLRIHTLEIEVSCDTEFGAEAAVGDKVQHVSTDRTQRDIAQQHLFPLKSKP